MKKLKLGDSELEILRHVARHPAVPVRELTETFSESRGWVRTTVLKTLDRLREKGLVERDSVDGLFRYTATMTEEDMEQALVHQFMTQSMEGSVKPLVAYLHQAGNLTGEDIEDLKKLVEQLERKER